MKLLFVEDEEKIANFVAKGLKEEHYEVDVAASKAAALELAEKGRFDLLILDLMLPDGDGLEVARRFRSRGDTVPILMLTARSSVRDKVEGLDAGADDYLTKPFEFEELLARIRALLRRARSDKQAVLAIGGLELDLVSRRVRREGKEIVLTNKEYSLLEFLLENAGQVVTRNMISERVWEQEFDPITNVIDVYVNYLRSKIDKGFSKPLINTVRGVGYVIRE
jgi:DNA-binding response OmpR family regulator